MTTSEVPDSLQHDVTFPAGAADIVILLGGWGGANDDLTGDGTVGPADLALLLSQW